MIRALVTACALATGALAPMRGDAADPARLNMVVIVVDDLRWDELSCAGHPFVRTPNIDRLAREGARFRSAFCTTPLCSPARASLLTGRYTHRHGILDNTNRSEQSHRMWTFPQALRQAGYETAFIGKWHMGNDDTQRPGFDQWACLKGQGTSFDPVMNVNGRHESHRGHTTDVLNERAIAFVNQSREAPFCLYLAHKGLHPEVVQYDDGTVSNTASRFLPAKRHEQIYANAGIPRRLNVTDDLQGKPAIQQVVDRRLQTNYSTTSDETVRDRLRMLAAIDEGVGDLLQALEKLGQLDHTVIVFTSDHGYWYGEHQLGVERRLPYEEGLRVPLVIRYPGAIGQGRIVDQVALGIDLAPTLLALAEIETDQEIDGRSLLPLFGEAQVDWSRSFLIEYNSDIVFPHMQKMGYKALRTDRWKYIRYNEREGMNELYDLSADPYEMNNLIHQPGTQTVVEDLNDQIDKLVAPHLR